MTIRHSLAVSALACVAVRAMSFQPAGAPLMLRGMQIAYGPEDDRGQKSAAELATEFKADFDQKLDGVKALAEKAVADAVRKAREEMRERCAKLVDDFPTGRGADRPSTMIRALDVNP